MFEGGQVAWGRWKDWEEGGEDYARIHNVVQQNERLDPVNMSILDRQVVPPIVKGVVREDRHVVVVPCLARCNLGEGASDVVVDPEGHV